MNLSRRGFLKSLLATSSLAPIAPALIEATGLQDAVAAKWAEMMDWIIASRLRRVEPVDGFYYMVMNPRMVDDLRMFGHAFSRDGEYVSPFDVFEVEGVAVGSGFDNPLFKGEMSYIDDGIRWPVEQEPIDSEWPKIKVIEPVEFEPEPHLTFRRVTREQLLTEGFTRT